MPHRSLRWTHQKSIVMVMQRFIHIIISQLVFYSMYASSWGWQDISRVWPHRSSEITILDYVPISETTFQFYARMSLEISTCICISFYEQREPIYQDTGQHVKTRTNTVKDGPLQEIVLVNMKFTCRITVSWAVICAAVSVESWIIVHGVQL